MNAIILAAGLGTRFKEWTKDNHKSLFPIQGTPNIERTINYLIEAEIDNIYIVVGHMSRKFTYLKEKYEQVTLIYNSKYNTYNSIYTFSLVLNYFSNSWVIDADTVLMDNVFKNRPKKSTYYTIIRNSESFEWCPVMTGDKVMDILVTNQALPSLSGISYWHKNDCEIITRLFKQYMKENCLLNSKLYWDDVVKDNITKLDVTMIEVPKNIIFEMDEQKEYFEILNYIETKWY